jgi:hypothetical protein
MHKAVSNSLTQDSLYFLCLLQTIPGKNELFPYASSTTKGNKQIFVYFLSQEYSDWVKLTIQSSKLCWTLMLWIGGLVLV